MTTMTIGLTSPSNAKLSTHAIAIPAASPTHKRIGHFQDFIC